jgi:hypothetical protein
MQAGQIKQADSKGSIGMQAGQSKEESRQGGAGRQVRSGGQAGTTEQVARKAGQRK